MSKAGRGLTAPFLNVINSKMMITNIASSNTIVSLCQNSAGGKYSYSYSDGGVPSDYASALIDIGATYYPIVNVIKSGSITLVIIQTVANASGKPAYIFGYFVPDRAQIIWGDIF